MLTKAKVKFIQGLQTKRHRDEAGLFVAEGDKVVHDLLASELEVAELYCSQTWAQEYEMLLTNRNVIPQVVPEHDLGRITNMTTATEVLAVVRTPHHDPLAMLSSESLTIALDRTQDPGNVGTIIRTAEWFGFKGVLCSHACADPFGPKAVQAAMGALFRLPVSSCDLQEVLSKSSVPVIVASLNGDSLYDSILPIEGVVVIGNESQGVSQEITAMAARQLMIPSAHAQQPGAGLNAAVAAAIVCAEFARRATRSDITT